MNINFPLVILIISGYFVLKNGLKNYNADNILNNANNDNSTQLAIQIYNAAHTGVFGTTEDEELIIQLGSQIKDWPKVRQAYLTLYKSELSTDLEKWLNPEELQRFFAAVRAASGSSSGGTSGGTTTGGSTGTTPTRDPNYPDLPYIVGRILLVNPNRTVTVKDTAGKSHTYAANEELGTATGWLKRDGKVYIYFRPRVPWYNPTWTATTQLVDANFVRFK
ncbi:hypothetical protein [Tellurirhabdus rosea]|uniref:hypothetical protein n=1 Tax=Tellurirhabdus rosea TaxID=2674997 RepID=UPI00225A7FF8|nr:hypothetical protein [Tellurirhabdus rosea]